MGKRYAILINGSDESRYHDNIENIYDTLLELGFDENCVHVLDRSSTNHLPYPIRSAPTKVLIGSIFSDMERYVSRDDILVVHIDDHGDLITTKHKGKNKDMAGIVLDQGYSGPDSKQYLTEIDLDEMLSQIRSLFTVITTDVCYGGRIAKRIGGRERCVGISACGTDESANTLRHGRSFSSYFYKAFMNRELVGNSKGVNMQMAFRRASQMYREDDSLWGDWKDEPIPTPHIFTRIDPSRLKLE